MTALSAPGLLEGSMDHPAEEPGQRLERLRRYLCVLAWRTGLAPTGSLRDSLMGCPLQFCFHFAVTTQGGFSIEPRARRRRRMVFPAEALLIERMLPIISRYHMSKIGVVNVTAMEFVCSRPLEGIRRGLVDEGSQKLSFTLSKQHA
jgi:hypothetical protein